MPKTINVRLNLVIENGHLRRGNLTFGCGVMDVMSLVSASFMLKMLMLFFSFRIMKKPAKKNKVYILFPQKTVDRYEIALGQSLRDLGQSLMSSNWVVPK